MPSLLLLLLACTPKPSDAPIDSAPSSADSHSAQDSAPSTSSYSFDADTVTVTVIPGDLRSFTLTSTHTLRGGGAPSDGTLLVQELPDRPQLHSGSPLLDALFALASQEAQQASVEAVSDGSFNSGAPVACSCYETGEDWPWVWTRDTAYATDLGLVWLDPERAQRSLEFKLSALKDGGEGLTIVQDTGSGGSWPVSSDRVVWALGAQRLLNTLPEAQRAAFADTVYGALQATLTQDRQTLYDPKDGLYRGETSFLDWREQSYPLWTATDTRFIAESKSLSTNVLHAVALQLAADLAAERGDSADWSAWAAQLRADIHAAFWLEDQGLWSSVITGSLSPGAEQHYDALGTTLAALYLDQDEAAALAMAHTPHGPYGPPVIWPQLPQRPIYHNRAVWPFVTAYSLRAAAHTGNDALIDLNLRALIRGAAVNLSNMENFEWSTGSNLFTDGELSGPVLNSRRQLWSVGGFVGAVVEGLFGVQASAQGLSLNPSIPADFAEEYLPLGGELRLQGLRWRGRSLNITVQLPDSPGEGLLTVLERRLNDSLIGDEPLASLPDDATLTLRLGAGSGSSSYTAVSAETPSEAVYAPLEPEINTVTWADGAVQISWTAAEGLHVDLFRDGERIAQDLDQAQASDSAPDPSAQAPCYTVQAVHPDTGLRSFHSKPVCLWGESGERVSLYSPYTLANAGGLWSTDHGRAHIGSWGDPDDTLTVHQLRPAFDGEHLLQLVYSNGGALNTGITAGLKRVTVTANSSGATVAEGVLVLPHTGAWDSWAESTLLPVTLDASERYTVQVSDLPQMSALSYYTLYSSGEGGGDAPFNRVNVAELKVLALAGGSADISAGDLVPLSGADDIDRFDPAQVLSVGLGLESWSRFAMDWDEDWIYLALNCSALEDLWAPFILYLEPDPSGSSSPGQGISYSGLTPTLPFTPSLAITLRAQSDDGSGAGPWAGLWRNDGAHWTQLRRWEPGLDLWQDEHTLALRLPRALLGQPSSLRMAGHVVWARAGDEWKDTVPPGHSPWSADGGSAYVLDLDADHAVSSWLER